jgi:galactokinase
MTLPALLDAFTTHFGGSPTYAVRAPGRVNLIGEHIDYSGGLVLPMAINREVRLVVRPRQDQRFVLHSLQFNDHYDGSLPHSKVALAPWVNYVFGVVHEFMAADHPVRGFEAVFDGDVPVGSGLSSSAALEVAVAWYLHRSLGTNHTRMELAILCQHAENHFVGVNCGLMDQAVSAGAAEGAAFSLDCAARVGSQIPLNFREDVRFLIVHSGVARRLADSAYNERRAACEAALSFLNETSGKNYPFLCAVPLTVLEDARGRMDPVTYQRARHAIGEQARVVAAQEALVKGDAVEFGRLLNESHRSLAEDYEVSISALDSLTGWLRSRPGVYGSRLTGAGFGGCTVSLVAADRAQEVLDGLPQFFSQEEREMSLAFVSGAEPGAGDLSLT